MASMFVRTLRISWAVVALLKAANAELKVKKNDTESVPIYGTWGSEKKGEGIIGVSLYEAQQNFQTFGMDAYQMGVFFIPTDLDPAPIYSTGHECGVQEFTIPDEGINSAADCARALPQYASRCGPQFMFAPRYPSWRCACCTVKGADKGKANQFWNVYTARYFHPGDVSNMPTLEHHVQGRCGASLDEDVKALTGVAFEATYSFGQSNVFKYDQTFAAGKPGKYVGQEGGESNMVWKGDSRLQYISSTPVKLETFVKAIQEQSYKMNEVGPYSLDGNSCQDFSKGVLELLQAKDLNRVLHPYMVGVTMLPTMCNIIGLDTVLWLAGLCKGVPRPIEKTCRPAPAPKYTYDVHIAGAQQIWQNRCDSFCYANFNPFDYKCKAHTGDAAKANHCWHGYSPRCGSMASCHCSCE
jgi:hypothetical protein